VFSSTVVSYRPPQYLTIVGEYRASSSYYNEKCSINKSIKDNYPLFILLFVHTHTPSLWLVMTAAEERGIKIVEHPSKLPIDKHALDESDKRLVHGSLFPSCLRCLIVGSSGSGKTNLMLHLLQHRNGLRYENVYLVSKSIYQPKYVNLKKVYESIPQIRFNCYDNLDDVPEPENCKPNSVIVFDDVSSTSEPNAKLRAYFSTCRHKGNSVFLLIQSYARIPKHVIRDNCNFVILFKQDALNAHHVYRDHLSSDLSLTKFQDICSHCWKEPFGFLVIDSDSPINKGKLRSSLYHFIHILDEK